MTNPKMDSLQKEILALERELARLHQQRDSAQVEAAKSYADAFIRKLEASDIPLKVGLQAFKDLAKFDAKAKRAAPPFG